MCTFKYVLRDIAGAASNIHEEVSSKIFKQEESYENYIEGRLREGVLGEQERV